MKLVRDHQCECYCVRDIIISLCYCKRLLGQEAEEVCDWKRVLGAVADSENVQLMVFFYGGHTSTS